MHAAGQTYLSIGREDTWLLHQQSAILSADNWDQMWVPSSCTHSTCLLHVAITTNCETGKYCMIGTACTHPLVVQFLRKSDSFPVPAAKLIAGSSFLYNIVAIWLKHLADEG